MRSAEYLKSKNVDFKTITLTADVHTAAEVADACNCSLAQVLKSLVFMHKGNIVLALIPGDLRVEGAKLAALSGAPSLKMASREDVLRFTGYEIGTVSPFGLNSRVRKVMDIHVLDQDSVLVGSGERRTLLKLQRFALEEIWDGLVGDISLEG